MANIKLWLEEANGMLPENSQELPATISLRKMPRMIL